MAFSRNFPSREDTFNLEKGNQLFMMIDWLAADQLNLCQSWTSKYQWTVLRCFRFLFSRQFLFVPFILLLNEKKSNLPRRSESFERVSGLLRRRINGLGPKIGLTTLLPETVGRPLDVWRQQQQRPLRLFLVHAAYFRFTVRLVGNSFSHNFFNLLSLQLNVAPSLCRWQHWSRI